MSEVWKDILDYPHYQVSTQGRVYSKKTNKILKQSKDKNGYYRLWLSNKSYHTIHRLVAITFLKGDNKLQAE